MKERRKMKRPWVLLAFLPLLLWTLPAQAVEVDTSGGWAYEQVGEAKYQLVWIKGGGGVGGGASTIADGADETQGAKADTAITDATTTNTLMSFLKGLVKILADVWDSTDHFLNVSLATYIEGEDATNHLIATSGGPVRTYVVATGMVVAGDSTITATTASQAVMTGWKTFQGKVSGTGAVTQVQEIRGGFVSPLTTANSTVLCTLTLSGTTDKYDWCPPIIASFPFLAVVTSGTTGTSATGEVTLGQ